MTRSKDEMLGGFSLGWISKNSGAGLLGNIELCVSGVTNPATCNTLVTSGTTTAGSGTSVSVGNALLTASAMGVTFGTPVNNSAFLSISMDSCVSSCK